MDITVHIRPGRCREQSSFEHICAEQGGPMGLPIFRFLGISTVAKTKSKEGEETTFQRRSGTGTTEGLYMGVTPLGQATLLCQEHGQIVKGIDGFLG